MPDRSSRSLIPVYEALSAGTFLSTVLCGIALLMRPDLILWAVGLFIGLAALSACAAAYLLVRHAYHDPRFKGATLLVWMAISVFVLVFLWVRYGAS